MEVLLILGNKTTRTILVSLVILTVIVSLIYAQYTYSSKTKAVNNVKYVGTITIDSQDIVVFNYKSRLVGFTATTEQSSWLVKGSEYVVEYKDQMWHRDNLKLVDYEAAD